jgi:hypothetical protein
MISKVWNVFSNLTDAIKKLALIGRCIDNDDN